MGRGTDCGCLQFTRRDRGCCYPLSGRKRRPDYACYSTVGNWLLMLVANCAFPAGPMAAAQRLGICCYVGTLLLRTLFRPVQHRSELHDGGSSKSCSFNATSADHGRRCAARNRTVNKKTVGVCVAILGVFAALASGLAAAPAGAWRGELIMTGAVLCMAFYNVWSRPFIQRSSALGFLTVGMGAGAVALVAVGLLTGRVAVLSSWYLSRDWWRRARVHPF